LSSTDFDIVVIGGGSGGLVVAAGGAALGAKVALIEKLRLGGDCLWTGCIPSKALIKSARVAYQMRNADRFALTPHDPKPQLPRVMERVAAVIAGIAPNDSPERFRSLGVDVIFGSGRFIDASAFEVDSRRLRARTFVIATGSRPAIPPIFGIESVPFLTTETIFDLREAVPHLIIVGSGPVGSEMAQAFRRLGSEVTVVDIAPGILPREDFDLATIVFRQLRNEGIRYHLSASIAKVERTPLGVRMLVRAKDSSVQTIDATHLLVAAGRHANIEDLGLGAANIRVAGDRIVLDDGLRTTNRRVYVIGDAASGHQFTHLAEHHAGIVLRHAIFKLKWTKPSSIVPWCTFTDPEFARVGLSEAEAKKSGVDHRVYLFPLSDVDRARAESEIEGMAKLVTAPRGRVLGAAIVAPHAGELIGEYGLAIANRMKAADISAVIHTYPTFAQINRRVADMRQKEALTPGTRAWVKRLFRLRGA